MHESLQQVKRDSAAIEERLREESRLADLRYRDLLMMILRCGKGDLPFAAGAFEVKTDYPVALDSADHQFPWGTVNDNTRSPRFVAACERYFHRQLRHLDLGCSGGGLVLDFLLRGHVSVGLEGSDVSLRAQRAEWRLLRNNLLTCDISRPFDVYEVGCEGAVRFDVITAWEVVEHIANEDLPTLMENVQKHLAPDGLFVGSVTTIPDTSESGAEYHRTVAPKAWWVQRFRELGMEMLENHPFVRDDFCRGTGNGPLDPDFACNPEQGFHFVCRKAKA
jgi:2-polyprenyl-3-methyl-5-hydroxy-6-metoxy-1,4-benzoquinol methylase